MKKIYYKRLIHYCPYSKFPVGGNNCIHCIFNQGHLKTEKAIFCDLEDKKTKFTKKQNLYFVKSRYMLIEKVEIVNIQLFQPKQDRISI